MGGVCVISVFLLLWPLRFPPVPTWLSFTIVLKELQAVWKEFQALFFLSLSPSFCPLFYWKGGVGASVIVEHLSSSQLERQSQLGDLWQHLQDAKPSNMLLITQSALLGSGDRKDMVWWAFMESMFGIHADRIWCEHLPSWDCCN